MWPLIIRGNLWRVVRVSPGDPLLVDRTGTHTIATTDPVDRVIRISESVPVSMFDKVLLHEATHAMMEEAGVTDLLRQTDGRDQVMIEELLAWFLETYAIEVIDAVERSLDRQVCVDDLCL